MLARSFAILALPVLAALAAPSTAVASASSDGNRIIAQCVATDSVSGRHSQQAYQYALSHLPSDVAEYSDCADVIRRAALAAAGGQTPGAGGSTQGGAFRDPYATASPTERAAIVRAQRARPERVRVGSDLIRPGFVGVHPASFTRSMPGSLLAALIALACAGATGLGWGASQRVRARRRR